VTALAGSAGRTIVGISVACEISVMRPARCSAVSVSSTFEVNGRLLVSRTSEAMSVCACCDMPARTL